MSEVEKAVTLTMAVGDTDEEAAAAKVPDADDAAEEEEETASQQLATIKTPEIVILADTTNPDVRLPPRYVHAAIDIGYMHAE